MTRRSKIPRPPTLTPEDLGDASKLLGILDAVVTADDNYRRLTAKILEAQDRLQSLCDEEAWLAYLDIEQLVNERANIMLARVARFAFYEGRRHQRHGRG